MGKGATDDVLDKLLDNIRLNVNLMVLLKAEPTSYASAMATVGAGGHLLASYAMTSLKFTKGDYAGGRQLTVTAMSTATVLSTDSANHLGYLNTASATLKAWTTVTAQSLTSGNNVSVPSHYIRQADPT